MNQILESVRIALSSIWANKLRSFMTVLGNIVAVTSIVTVVTLIQGMNAMVSTAIVSDVGADSFTIQRLPPIRSEDDEERTRNNPLLTLDEADAIRAFSPLVTRGDGAGAARRHGVVSRPASSVSVQVQGVTSEYVNFSNFNAERGRLMSPTEVERSRRRGRHRLGRRGPSCSGRTIRSTRSIRIEGMPFRVVGVSKKKGRSSATRRTPSSIIPLGAYQKLFGARQSLQLVVKPHVGRSSCKPAMDDATVALRVHAAAQAGASATTSASSPPTRSWTSTSRRRPASSRCWSAWSRCRSSSAASSS